MSMFTPTSAARLHRPSHCAAVAGKAAAECGATDQRERAPRSRNRLRHRQSRADAGAAGCAAASSDDGQHGNDSKRRSAAWRGGKDQPSDGATEKPREAAANRRAGPSCRGERGRATQPQGDQLARRRERCGLAENRHRAGLRRHPIAYRATALARMRGAGECRGAEAPRTCRARAAARPPRAALPPRSRWPRRGSRAAAAARYGSTAASAWRRTVRRRRRLAPCHSASVVFFDHVCEDELVSVA